MTALDFSGLVRLSTGLFGFLRLYAERPSRLARDRPYSGGQLSRRAFPLVASIVLLGFLTACSTTDDRLIATVTEDGQRAYRAQGIIQFTASEAAAEAYIAERVEAACGSPVAITELSFTRMDSMVGLPHLAYRALVVCVEGAL